MRVFRRSSMSPLQARMNLDEDIMSCLVTVIILSEYQNGMHLRHPPFMATIRAPPFSEATSISAMSVSSLSTMAISQELNVCLWRFLCSLFSIFNQKTWFGGNELNRLFVTSPALKAFGKRFFHGTTFHLHFLKHQCLLFIYIKSPALHPFD